MWEAKDPRNRKDCIYGSLLRVGRRLQAQLQFDLGEELGLLLLESDAAEAHTTPELGTTWRIMGLSKYGSK